MAIQPGDEIIELLHCDIGERPKSAPGPDSLGPHILGVTRVPGALLVAFHEQALDTLEAFVEAERVCCGGIDWQIERSHGLRLRISAGDVQLNALESLFNGQI